MPYLAEPELVVLAGELEVAADEDEDAARERRRGLAVDGGDGVPALAEGQLRQLPADLLGARDGVALEGEHGGVGGVERRERAAVGVERAVVVVHECPRHRVAVAPRSAAAACWLPVHCYHRRGADAGCARAADAHGDCERAREPRDGICRRAAAALPLMWRGN